jgi:hypothetical protein
MRNTRTKVSNNTFGIRQKLVTNYYITERERGFSCMVKGVNKLIVEVANPNSEFFERAIFFVKPQMKDIPPKELSKSADALISTQDTRNAAKQRRCDKGGGRLKVLFVFAFAGTAGLGAAVAAVVLSLLA